MATDTLSHPKYRRDIDGLRAIAVLSVVGFHAAPGRITGGFIGVDIFFVISGFLISTIILENLTTGSFSFSRFYERRIKRIFPALLCVLILCLVFGSLLLTAEEYQEAGQHIAAGAGFYSNFLLWMESGYFDSESSMKPLLHLWSLSIEEQFYIVWPLLLWSLFRFKANMLGAMMVLALCSFGLNVLTVPENIIAAFYSPLTRAWELLAGAILAFASLHRNDRLIADNTGYRNAACLIGALLLITGLALINENRQFPGWWAIFPVLGTVLLIAAGEQAWINRRVLSNGVLVWFGLISYPLYLTHWPLLSFLRILNSGEVSPLARVCALLLAIVLSWLIYTCIEKPIRFGLHYRAKTLSIFTAMALVFVGGIYIYQQHGLSGRITAPPAAVNSGDIGHRPFFEYMETNFFRCTPDEIWRAMDNWEGFQRCYQSKKNVPNEVALIGDSHAEHLFIGLAQELQDLGVVYYAKGGPPFPGNPDFDRILSVLAGDSSIRVVFVAAKWQQVLAELDNTEQVAAISQLIELLSGAQKKIYIVDDVPGFGFDPGKCKYAGRLGQENTCRQDIEVTRREHSQYYPLFAYLSNAYPSVEIIRTSDFFCDDTWCSMSSNGVMHYRDRNHLNVDGSKALWRYIMGHSDLRHALARRNVE